jgi:maltose-binding protein MalE
MREIRFVNVSVLLFSLATLSASSAAEAPAPQTLKDLVAKARESNHTVTVALEATDAEIVKAKEETFQKKFGFPVKIESQPGHHRDMPLKVVESAKSGRAVIDMWNGGRHAGDIFPEGSEAGALPRQSQLIRQRRFAR